MFSSTKSAYEGPREIGVADENAIFHHMNKLYFQIYIFFIDLN